MCFGSSSIVASAMSMPSVSISSAVPKPPGCTSLSSLRTCPCARRAHGKWWPALLRRSSRICVCSLLFSVRGRATVMVDSGIRSGLDVVRAVALGADAAFAGKAFLWGLGALGGEGPLHVIDLMIDEMKAAFGQIGARRPAQARSVVIRHPGALHF